MKKKLKVGLVGASGRMGQEITEILKTKNNLELYLAVCRKSSLAEFAYTRQTPNCPEAKDVDIWIDFSGPEVLKTLLSVAIKNKTPVTSGTTGLASAAQASLKTTSP